MSSKDIVNAWFGERLGVWPLAGHTEAYNQVFAALPDLIERLDGPTPEPGVEEPADPEPAEPEAPAEPLDEPITE